MNVRLLKAFHLIPSIIGAASRAGSRSQKPFCLPIGTIAIDVVLLQNGYALWEIVPAFRTAAWMTPDDAR
jgi:hypothetical protein